MTTPSSPSSVLLLLTLLLPAPAAHAAVPLNELWRVEYCVEQPPMTFAEPLGCITKDHLLGYCAGPVHAQYVEFFGWQNSRCDDCRSYVNYAFPTIAPSAHGF